jgi:hypothetical protein
LRANRIDPTSPSFVSLDLLPNPRGIAGKARSAHDSTACSNQSATAQENSSLPFWTLKAISKPLMLET